MDGCVASIVRLAPICASCLALSVLYALGTKLATHTIDTEARTAESSQSILRAAPQRQGGENHKTRVYVAFLLYDPG